MFFVPFVENKTWFYYYFYSNCENGEKLTGRSFKYFGLIFGKHAYLLVLLKIYLP